MNAIAAAMRHVNARIPRQVLEAAFIESDQRMFKNAHTLEHEITKKVIEAFVIPDLNQFGQWDDLLLAGLQHDVVDYYTRIYTIPEEILQGRSIVAAHFAARTVMGGQYGLPPSALHFSGSRSSVMNAVNSVTQSHSVIPSTMSPEVRVLSPNTVEVRDTGQFTSTMRIRARMTMLDTLPEIKPPFYGEFSKLVEYAVKRYCHLNLSMDMDLAHLHHGMDFGRFKEWVDKWEDSYDLYDDQMKVMAQCLVHNDDRAAADLIHNGGKIRT